MEFDKTKVLTCMTADQARVGTKGWVANAPSDLARRVTECHPITLACVTEESMDKRFIVSANTYALFYPAPKSTYRAFAGAEEFKPYRDEWFGHKASADSLRSKVIDYSDSTLVVCDPCSPSNALELKAYSWDEFYAGFIRENGDPCGIIVEE